MRTRIVAGNWKMNTTPEEGKKLVSEMIPMIDDEIRGAVQAILIPPILHLSGLMSLFRTANSDYRGVLRIAAHIQRGIHR